MFLINQNNRVVDLPARMEEEGFNQARKVLSISKELMDGIPVGVTMTDRDAMNLRRDILAKFPDVITDDEYLQKMEEGIQAQVNEDDLRLVAKRKAREIKQEEIQKEEKADKKEEIVNMHMKKNDLIVIAKENNIQLNIQEKKYKKAKLVNLINERHKG